MRTEYRAGPVYRGSLIVTGGMCAGLGIATLTAPSIHRLAYARVLASSFPAPPASALGFLACGLALAGVGLWFPRVTAVLAMVTLGLAGALVAERLFGIGPRVETLIALPLGSGDWNSVAPNTVLVLALGAAALLLRHTHHWYRKRLAAIAILGSVVFAIGLVGCVGYMTGVESYVWQSRAPMSFLSALCSCVLGLGIVLSACRYSEMDESGAPRWFSLVVCTGALSINLATAVAYIARGGPPLQMAHVMGLAPMILVSGVLSVVAARQARPQSPALADGSVSRQHSTM